MYMYIYLYIYIMYKYFFWIVRRPRAIADGILSSSQRFSESDEVVGAGVEQAPGRCAGVHTQRGTQGKQRVGGGRKSESAAHTRT
jgi:hypothetical protein